MADRIAAMTDEQIQAMADEDWSAKRDEYDAFIGSLSAAEKAEFFNRLEAYTAKHDGRAHGFMRFIKTLGDVATLQFAAAAEMSMDGDHE